MQGSIIDLIGFAIGRDFASVATLEVKSFIEKYPQGAGIPYKDLIVASSVTPSRTCEGVLLQSWGSRKSDVK